MEARLRSLNSCKEELAKFLEEQAKFESWLTSAEESGIMENVQNATEHKDTHKVGSEFEMRQHSSVFSCLSVKIFQIVFFIQFKVHSNLRLHFWFSGFLFYVESNVLTVMPFDAIDVYYIAMFMHCPIT